MHLISLDIETTGLIQTRDHVLSVAMLSFDPLAKGEIEVSPRTAVEWRILWGHIHGEPKALAMNGPLLADIASAKAKIEAVMCGPLVHYIEPNKLSEVMTEWLQVRGFEKPTVTGKNVGSFDLPFIRAHCSQHFKSWGPMPKMRHRCLDIGSLLYDPTSDLCLPDTNECAIRLNVFPRKPETYGYQLPEGADSAEHSALPDAVFIADMIQAYYKQKSI